MKKAEKTKKNTALKELAKPYRSSISGFIDGLATRLKHCHNQCCLLTNNHRYLHHCCFYYTLPNRLHNDIIHLGEYGDFPEGFFETAIIAATFAGDKPETQKRPLATIDTQTNSNTLLG